MHVVMDVDDYLRNLADRMERGEDCRRDAAYLRHMADGFEAGVALLDEFLRREADPNSERRKLQ
jgi:hypothetical protein